MKPMEGSLPVATLLRFEDQQAWEAWLDKHHATSTCVWVLLAKKGSSQRSVSYSEALEAALCYGWIDAQKRPLDEHAWLQQFVPRKERSIWSKINRQKALALVRCGRIKAAGLRAIERAKKDGSWARAYDSPSGASVPRDFQEALEPNARAKAFFQTLDRANRYAVLYRIQTAKKPETRARRIARFITMLERHEKLHP